MAVNPSNTKKTGGGDIKYNSAIEAKKDHMIFLVPQGSFFRWSGGIPFKAQFDFEIDRGRKKV